MVDTATYKEKTRIERFTFSVRLKGIFFPLAFSDVVQLVDRAGFTLVAPLKERPSLPPGGQLVVVGRIAEKGDLKFNLDPERGVINLEGKNIEDVLSEFNAIEDLARREFAVDFNKEQRFYEILADLTVNTDKDPIKTMSKLFSDSKSLSTFSAILEDGTGNYGVRLVRKGQDPNQEEWWEYRIEPLLTKSRNTYYSTVVYRSEDKDKVVKAAKELIERVAQLIIAMEQL